MRMFWLLVVCGVAGCDLSSFLAPEEPDTSGRRPRGCERDRDCADDEECLEGRCIDRDESGEGEGEQSGEGEGEQPGEGEGEQPGEGEGEQPGEGEGEQPGEGEGEEGEGEGEGEPGEGEGEGEGEPAPGCVDDVEEDNDTNTTAAVIDASLFAEGSYELTGLKMCARDVDVFAIDVPAGSTVRLGLTHGEAFDLDVEALEQVGSTGAFRSLASGVRINGLDAVAGTINVDSRVLARVTTVDAVDDGVAYSLGIEVGYGVSDGSCVNDRFDTWSSTANTFINDARADLTFDSVTVAPTRLAPPETLRAMQICRHEASGDDDIDVYAVALTAGQRLSATVTYVHSAGDIDMRAFGPDNSVGPADADAVVDLLPCPSCAGTSGSETFAFTATVSGTHFIEVFGFNGSENTYELSAAVQ